MNITRLNARSSDCELFIRSATTTADLTCEISRNSEEYFLAFVYYGICLNIVGCFGILGNIISIIILSRPQMKSSINYLLIGLARFDTLLIVTSMLLFGLPSVYTYSGYLFTYYYNVLPYLAAVLYPLSMVAHTGSVYLTLAVTLERYLAVCHPLKARSLCTYGRARIYVYVVIVFSVLYNLPRFWEMNFHSSFLSTFNTTIHCVLASKLRHNPLYIAVYIQWCYLVTQYFLPFFFLAIFNIAISRQVRKANANRQRMSCSQQREIRLASMLLFVVSVFFLCNILPLINNVLELFYCIINDSSVQISNLLVTINSSVNFIIYVIFGEKFKCLFIELFCKNGLFRGVYKHFGGDMTQGGSSVQCRDLTNLRVQRADVCKDQCTETEPTGILLK